MTATQLRIAIVTTLRYRAGSTRELAEASGILHDLTGRKRIGKELRYLRRHGYAIVNLNLPGSHSGGQYVLKSTPPCPVLEQFGPEFVVAVPKVRCQRPGCRTYLARDHILAGGRYCSPCLEKMLLAELAALFPEARMFAA